MSLSTVPGLGDVVQISRAVNFDHVAVAHGRRAHGHEVGARASDRELGHFCKRLAHAGAEQERAHHFVESCSVLVKVRVGVEALAVDKVGFSCGNLNRKTKNAGKNVKRLLRQLIKITNDCSMIPAKAM